MDQVVKERERKKGFGRGRNGQTTSLDEIEPLRPQRAQHTNPGGQTHTPPHPRSPLLLLLPRTIDRCRCHCRVQTARLPCPYIAQPCPSDAWPRLDWQLAGWLAGWLTDRGGWKGQGRVRLVGRMGGWMVSPPHWGLTMGTRFDATRLHVPGTEMQVRTGDATAPKLGWKPRPQGFVGLLAAQGCTPDHCRPSVSSISTLRNTHPISRLACL